MKKLAMRMFCALSLLGGAGLARGAELPAADVAAGKDLYRRECAACHGPKGRGDGSMAPDFTKRPSNLTSKSMLDEDDDELQREIAEGKKQMPAYEDSLSEQQIKQLVIYMRHLGKAK